jgi:nitroreductase
MLASVGKGDKAMSISRGRQTGTAGESAAPEQIGRLAVTAAVLAPSVHNTQPWWFSQEEHEISVHADIERRLDTADPAGREMLISCGAAVFTIRVALRHLGYVPVASILPDPERPALVARVRWREQVPAVDYEEQLYGEIERRHTHRNGFLPQPPPARVLAALGEEAVREGAMLRIAGTDDERAALAAAVTAAEHAARLDPARTGELARWTRPPRSPRRDGIPATAYPARPGHSDPDFPGRDFARGQGWGLPPSMMAPLHRSAGVVALLATSVDQPADWIRSGQALQRVLLAAAANGVAAALHSQPLELPELREFIRIRLGGRAHPQMLLRFGATDEVTESTRRPVEEVLL